MKKLNKRYSYNEEIIDGLIVGTTTGIFYGVSYEYSMDYLWVKCILPFSNGKPVMLKVRRWYSMGGGYNYDYTEDTNFDINKIDRKPYNYCNVTVQFKERFKGGGIGRLDIISEFAEALFKLGTEYKPSKFTVGEAFNDISWEEIKNLLKNGYRVFSKDQRFEITNNGSNFNGDYCMIYVSKSLKKKFFKPFSHNRYHSLESCVSKITFNKKKDKFVSYIENKLFGIQFRNIKSALIFEICKNYGSIDAFRQSEDNIDILEFIGGRDVIK